ncbi:MAG: hypothetical protein R2789_14955 [Microthrixaceae bacterium]
MTTTRLSEALVDTLMPVHLPATTTTWPPPRSFGRGPGRGERRGWAMASTGRYETNVGPRWWSMDHTGSDLVALD